MKIFAFILLLAGIPLTANARPFTSSLNLKVFEYGFGLQPDRYLGFTSAKKARTVSVPSHDYWYVQPVGPLNDKKLVALAKELQQKRIPGLDLSNHWDANNKSLALLTEDGGPLRLLILTHTHVTDAGLAQLSKWPRLKYLAVPKQISDGGMRSLKGLKELQYLSMHRAQITDAGVAQLKDLQKLKTLDIGGTRITDSSAKTLQAMTSLRQLDVSDTAVSDQGFATLTTLTGLHTLYVSQNLTDTGLKSLIPFKKLKVLDLSGAPITNSGAAVLPAIGNLEELALSGTRVNDGALKHIARLKRLRALELSFTEVTPEGLPDLVGLKRLETLSLSWSKLTETDLRVLSELRSVKNIILNGEQVPPQVLARITALARANALQMRRTEAGPPVPLAGVAPTTHPGGKPLPGERLQDAKAPPASKPAPRSAALPPDLIPTHPSRPAIPLEPGTPTGKPIEIEVGARRSSRALTGLKRIHQMEITRPPRDPDVAPGGSRKITSPEENAVPLGEIDVYAR